jgi:hypothetical protein
MNDCQEAIKDERNENFKLTFPATSFGIMRLSSSLTYLGEETRAIKVKERKKI